MFLSFFFSPTDSFGPIFSYSLMRQRRSKRMICYIGKNETLTGGKILRSDS
jgi:hypothetical protein